MRPIQPTIASSAKSIDDSRGFEKRPKQIIFVYEDRVHCVLDERSKRPNGNFGHFCYSEHALASFSSRAALI